MRATRAAAAIATLLLAICGCGDGDAPAPGADPGILSLDGQEDPVCGMLVREQSAPRAQVRHRDGERFAFCSLGDLLVHLSAPSRHGAVSRILVEVLDRDEDPAATHRQPHPWVDAADASYVVGVPRTGIMGPPILSYRDRETADAVAQRYPGARSLDFEALDRWWRERAGASH